MSDWAVPAATGAVLALPLGWLVDHLVRRIPDRLSLWDPRPSLAFDIRRSLLGLVAGTLVALALWRFAPSPILEQVMMAGLFVVLLTLTVIDLECYRLPDAIVLPSVATVLVIMAVLSAQASDVGRLRAALVGGALYFVVLLIAHLLSPRGMGFGDVKLAALLGLCVGWSAGDVPDAISAVLWAMLIGFGVGALAGVAILIVRRRNRPFPFGPFLASGTIVVLLSGSASMVN